jgi:Ser/Thr protein kinase RdoA (MazF antagonist)
MQLISSLYSTLNSTELLLLIENNYTLSTRAKIKYLKRGFNDTYIIEDGHNKFILRVYKHGWKTHGNIETEISLLNDLYTNNISVSCPIADKNGEFVQTITAAEGIRYIVLFSFAQGQAIRKLNAEQSFNLGKVTGQMHLVTQYKSYGNVPFIYSFDKQLENTLTILSPILIAYPLQYKSLLALKNDFLNIWEKTNEIDIVKGTCHGDLQAENFHINDEHKITFFDFDFCGYGPLIYDIGVFLWYDHKNKNIDIVKSFLKGYTTQRPLTPTEISLLPYFGTLRALFQMTLYCQLNDGKQLPLWPADQVAAFIIKAEKWHSEQKDRIKWL